MAIVPPCQSSKDLDGKRTEVLLQTFADRILVLVTQMGKVGNLVHLIQHRISCKMLNMP
jgi:proteasome assembly chaperone 3